MEALRAYFGEHAVDGLISWHYQVEATERFSMSLAEIEAAILDNNLLPARYQRNREMLSTQQQSRLFRSRVAVIGCGGLGGYVLEELARLGVGQIVAIDADHFEEHNLNRQMLSSPRTLGWAKVEAAAQRMAEVNPAVTIRPVKEAISRSNGRELLAGMDCVVDAVDNVATRLDVEVLCSELNIPLVHGAIAGWYGHVATVLPGDDTLRRMIYRQWKGGKGVEQQLGNPSFTPAVIASMQAAEACKVLLGQGTLLRNRMLTFNLLDMQVDDVPL
jgi:molybdopterin/thiamine biosynthesis adenylyltransferase